MIVLMVQLNVDPERIDQFMEASKGVARASVHDEPGCRRFDIVQDEKVPTRVAFTEIFDDEAAVYAHPRFEHYPKWRAATADGSLAQGQWERVLVRKCHSVFPDDNANYDSVIPGVDESAPFESIYINHSAFRMKPERVDDFIAESRTEALRAIHDQPGCLRFDIYQTVDEPSLLWFYEVYTDREAFQRRSTAPGARRWAEKVKDWFSDEVPPAYRGPNIWPPSYWEWGSGKPRS